MASPTSFKGLTSKEKGGKRISDMGGTFTPGTPKTPLKKGPRQGFVRWLTSFIIIVIIVIGGLYLMAKFTDLNLPFVASEFSSEKWQAVFLSNGQVYFGKITDINRKTITLKEIYYLQVVTRPLQRSQPEETPPTQPEQRLTLVKLGNELHGPKDEMLINRSFVVIIEDLKPDSRVVRAIERYLEDQQAAE